MTMPSVVKARGMMLRRNARKAVLKKSDTIS